MHSIETKNKEAGGRLCENETRYDVRDGGFHQEGGGGGVEGGDAAVQK